MVYRYIGTILVYYNKKDLIYAAVERITVMWLRFEYNHKNHSIRKYMIFNEIQWVISYMLYVYRYWLTSDDKLLITIFTYLYLFIKIHIITYLNLNTTTTYDDLWISKFYHACKILKCQCKKPN